MGRGYGEAKAAPIAIANTWREGPCTSSVKLNLPARRARVAPTVHTGSSMLTLLLALPFAAALIIALARGASRRTIAWLAAAAPLLGLAVLAWLTPAVMAGSVLESSRPWIAQAGLLFTLRLDGLAWMFRPHCPLSRSRRRQHRHRLLRTVSRKQSWNTSATRSWPSSRS